MKYSLGFLAAMAIAMPALAADVQIDNCDSLRTGSGWEGVAGGGIVYPTSVALDTVNKTEGTGSVVANIENGGARWYECPVYDTFPAITDMSAFSTFSFQVKATNAPGCYMIPTITDAFGSGFRWLDWDALPANWTMRSYTLGGMERDPYAGAKWWDQTAMNRIKKVKFNVSQGSTIAATTTQVWFDDIRYNTGYIGYKTSVVEAFENPADWTVTGGGDVNNKLTIASDMGVVGNSIKFSVNMASAWDNVTMAKPFATPQDFTKFSALKYSLRGNLPATPDKLALMSLVDVNNNRVWSYVNKAVSDGDWSEMYCPLVLGNVDGSVDNFWVKDVWSGPTDIGDFPNTTSTFNLAQVKALQLNFQLSSAPTGAYTGDIWVDELVAVQEGATPYPAGAKSATAALAASAVAIDGTGSDSQWANAAWNGNFLADSNDQPVASDVASRFKVMYDATNLYFLIEQSSGATAKRYFTPNTDGATLGQAYGNAAYDPNTDGRFWIDSFSLMISPKLNTPDTKMYQVMPYLKTDASGAPVAGDAFLFFSNTSSWTQEAPAGSLVKSSVTSDKIVLEGKVPYTAFNIASLNPGGAAVVPAPTAASVWYLDATRACWLKTDSTESTAGSYWFDLAGFNGGELTFTNKAAVADWSQF